MAIEIVDFPIKIVDLSIAMLVYQRVSPFGTATFGKLDLSSKAPLLGARLSGQSAATVSCGNASTTRCGWTRVKSYVSRFATRRWILQRSPKQWGKATC